MSPLRFIALVGAVLLLSCRPCTTRPSAAEVILFISIDTLRVDFVGAYGYTRVRTPHIDALAKDGIRFLQAITVAPTTLPSHTSMMTGTVPHTHGVPDNGHEVPASNLMLAEILQAEGYRTIGFTGGYPLIRRFQFAQGFDEYHEVPSSDMYATDTGDQLTNDVLAWADQAGSGKLFLFVHYWDVHAPYFPLGRFNRMYRNDQLELTGSFRELGRLRNALKADRKKASARSEATKRLYAGGVSWTDMQVGRLLDGLGDRGLLKRALVILTSDHGESMDSHPREYWYHGNEVFDETTRVPLIIKLPESLGAGSVIEEPVSNVDIMPTILELQRLPIPDAVEGVSLALRLLNPSHALNERSIFSEATKPLTVRPKDDAWTNSTKCRALWTANWKVHSCPHDGHQALYDRNRDPNEMQNLLPATDPETQRIHEALAQELAEWGPSTRVEEGAKDEDPTVVDQLRALGYVE